MNFFNYRWDYLNSYHLFSYTCYRYHLGTTFSHSLFFFVNIKKKKKNYFKKLAVSENSGKIYSCYSLFSFSYAADSIWTLILPLTHQSSLFDQTLFFKILNISLFRWFHLLWCFISWVWCKCHWFYFVAFIRQPQH